MVEEYYTDKFENLWWLEVVHSVHHGDMSWILNHNIMRVMIISIGLIISDLWTGNKSERRPT